MTLTEIQTELKTFIHPESAAPAFTDIDSASVTQIANEKIPEAIALIKDPIHFSGLVVHAEPITLNDNAARDCIYVDISTLTYDFSRPIALRIIGSGTDYVHAEYMEDPEDFQRHDSRNFLLTVDEDHPIYSIIGGELVSKPRKAAGRASYFTYIKEFTALSAGSSATPFDNMGDRVLMNLIIGQYFRTVHEDEAMAQQMEGRAASIAQGKMHPIVVEKGQ